MNDKKGVDSTWVDPKRFIGCVEGMHLFPRGFVTAQFDKWCKEGPNTGWPRHPVIKEAWEKWQNEKNVKNRCAKTREFIRNKMKLPKKEKPKVQKSKNPAVRRMSAGR